jgi:hypothetical protein
MTRSAWIAGIAACQENMLTRGGRYWAQTGDLLLERSRRGVSDHDPALIPAASPGFWSRAATTGRSGATSEASTRLPSRRNSRSGRRLRSEIQRQPVNSLAEVPLIIRRDEEDFISRFRPAAQEVGQRRNGGVSVVERVDQVASAGEARVRHGLLEDIGRLYLSTYPLKAACSTAGSAQTYQ